jgi:hypothetical protein
MLQPCFMSPLAHPCGSCCAWRPLRAKQPHAPYNCARQCCASTVKVQTLMMLMLLYACHTVLVCHIQCSCCENKLFCACVPHSVLAGPYDSVSCQVSDHSCGKLRTHVQLLIMASLPRPFLRVLLCMEAIACQIAPCAQAGVPLLWHLLCQQHPS